MRSEITVKGVVTSATDQQPLIGTTVQVKGTGTGTITGIDGDYTLPNDRQECSVGILFYWF